MKTTTLLEVLQAAQFTHLVQSEWTERGGIMLVAPPATWKTTLVNTLDTYPDALVLSDVNVKTLSRLLDDISVGRYKTLAFPEYEKIYQRNPQTASNIEGHIKQLAEEGFRVPSFVDSRMPGTPARALIVGAITPACMRKHYDDWIDDGFARRFLWCIYSFRTSIIADAIDRWKKEKLSGFSFLNIPMSDGQIQYNLTPEESRYIRVLVKHQRGQETPFALMKKIACVLKARDMAEKTKGRWMTIMEDFKDCLTEKGAILTV